MTRDENLDRLRAATSARIAVSMEALPYVFLAPIHLVEQDQEDPTIVVTIDPATTRLDALDEVVVAVHTDGTDEGGAPWQVLVQGLSTLLMPPPLEARAPVDEPDGRQARVGVKLIRGWRTPPT